MERCAAYARWQAAITWACSLMLLWGCQSSPKHRVEAGDPLCVRSTVSVFLHPCVDLGVFQRPCVSLSLQTEIGG